MKLTIEPGLASGAVTAPPSKSFAHRVLICSALSGRPCTVENMAWSDDILATLDCLTALGAQVEKQVSRRQNAAVIDGAGIFAASGPVCLPCRASGSTLRFLIPVVLALGRPATFTGEASLFSRPLDYYERICRMQDLTWEKGEDSLRVEGQLEPDAFEIPGDLSSQFVTGMLLALPLLDGQSEIRLLPPITSRPYIELTQAVIRDFGIRAISVGSDRFHIPANQSFRPHRTSLEGDWTNGAVWLAMNLLGSRITVKALADRTVQGDKISQAWFTALRRKKVTLDVSDHPDLAPLLMACASVLHGAVLTGCGRLQYKESPRGEAMAAELRKFGADVLVDDDKIWIGSGALHRPAEDLCSHNDHRIVMALAVLCTLYGGTIRGAEAVSKSYPEFFDLLRGLGVEIRAEEAPALPAGEETQHESGF